MISKLNAFKLQEYFHHPSKHEKAQILRFQPKFRSGRLNPEEKKILSRWNKQNLPKHRF